MVRGVREHGDMTWTKECVEFAGVAAPHGPMSAWREWAWAWQHHMDEGVRGVRGRGSTTWINECMERVGMDVAAPHGSTGALSAWAGSQQQLPRSSARCATSAVRQGASMQPPPGPPACHCTFSTA
eukprot:188470-Chlamydomonas_euryale.AAC.2